MSPAPPLTTLRTYSRTIAPPGNLTALRHRIAALPGGAILESLSTGPNSRFSIFAAYPVQTVQGQWHSSAFQSLPGLFSPQFQVDADQSEYPLFGGWIGHIDYETAYELESCFAQAATTINRPTVRWSLFDTFLIYDYLKNSWSITAIDLPDTFDRPPASSRMQDLEQLVLNSNVDAATDFTDRSPVHPGTWNYSNSSYLDKCRRVIDYIEDGDVFQVNLARCYSQQIQFSPITLYDNLCHSNPSSYAAFLNMPDGAIISSSPELFLQVKHREVTTRPIKGTRPRTKNSSVDENGRRDLATNQKDRAELDMIIDLQRNDLGRVCEPGTIEVVSRGDIESLPTVFHRTATIRGRLRDSVTGLDLLRAAFPGGSITGAPKIRAMQIIRELEPCPRGPYCGAIGYISLTGDMQLNLAIRTMTVNNDTASFHVGSGIVADSIPEQELAELDAKASALLTALAPEQSKVQNRKSKIKSENPSHA